MAVNIDEDTEFNDALRKHGIIPERPPTPPTPPPPPSPTFSDLLEDFTPSELLELGEDAQDDDAERVIESFRRQRLADQKKEDKRARFGRVYPIGRDDYTREVTEASKIDEDEEEGEDKGTPVVCFLYKDGLSHSDRAFSQIRILADRYPRTKFVSIVGDKCIPNLPDTRIPMIIMYKKGEILNQVVAWGADRERRIEELEALLMVAGALHIPEHKHEAHQSRHSDNESDDDEQHAGAVNSKSRKNLRTGSSSNEKGKKDDDDSDFEFDL